MLAQNPGENVATCGIILPIWQVHTCHLHGCTVSAQPGNAAFVTEGLVRTEPTVIQPRLYKQRFRQAMRNYFLVLPSKVTPWTQQIHPQGGVGPLTANDRLCDRSPLRTCPSAPRCVGIRLITAYTLVISFVLAIRKERRLQWGQHKSPGRSLGIHARV